MMNYRLHALLRAGISLYIPVLDFSLAIIITLPPKGDKTLARIAKINEILKARGPTTLKELERIIKIRPQVKVLLISTAEILRVVVKPLSFLVCQFYRIERTYPIIVGPAATADKNCHYISY